MTTPALLNWFVSLSIVGAASAVLSLIYWCNQHWKRYWRILAFLPLAILVLWSMVTVIEFVSYDNLHPFWFLEFYGWVLFSTVYIGGLLSAKKYQHFQ